MTLYELGEEYLKQAAILNRLVENYSVQRKNLSGLRLAEMNGRIVVLKEMERDTRITGKQLTSYYNKDEKRKHYMSHNNIPF